MKLAVEQHDDSLLSVRDNTVANLYLNHLALDHQKLINTTQTAEKAIVISTTAESDHAAVDIASTNTSQDFKEFMSKIFTNQDLGFKPNKGATPTQKDVERFARIMSVISAAAITTEKTDSKAKTDFKGYDSKNFFTKILPGLGWLPKNERNALEGILKIARDLNATDKAVLQYQLSTIKTVEQYNRYQSIFNTTKTEEGVVSLTADENGSMSEDSADNFHNSDKQVQLLLDTNNSGTLDSK